MCISPCCILVLQVGAFIGAMVKAWDVKCEGVGLNFRAVALQIKIGYRFLIHKMKQEKGNFRLMYGAFFRALVVKFRVNLILNSSGFNHW